MPDLKALVFDMDGVILDNVPYHAQAFQLLFRDLGLEADAAQLLRRLNGMPTADILKQVFDHPVPEKELTKYSDQREFMYRSLYWDHRQPLAGLVGLLEAARESGLKVGLGTGSANDTLSYILDYLDLRRLFDMVVGEGEVDEGKPHSETYKAVAKKLGVDPENCLVFEDAILGEQSAYRAGMRCIALTTTLPAQDFQAPLTAIPNFVGMMPDDLRTMFEQAGPVPKPSEEKTQAQYLKSK